MTGKASLYKQGYVLKVKATFVVKEQEIYELSFSLRQACLLWLLVLIKHLSCEVAGYVRV